MVIEHAKSTCCKAKIIRYGSKRRQCTGCLKTWRIKPCKRGRKSQRIKSHFIKNIIEEGKKIKHLSSDKRTYERNRKRFTKSLNAFVVKPRSCFIRGKKLVLFVDAQWQRFEGEYWTLYFLAVKSIDSDKVSVLDPALFQGRESLKAWRSCICNLPSGIKKRIIAAVSDGFHGLDHFIITQGWIVQRCHFHLIKELQRRRSKHKSLPDKNIREAIYLSVRTLLNTTSDRGLNELIRLANRKDCPKKLRMLVHEFCRCKNMFRSYLYHPELCLPNTNNVMESIGSVVRDKTRKLRTPKSWYKWAVATIRKHPKFVCKRA